MWASAGPGPSSVLQNSGSHALRFTTCQREIATGKIQEKKITAAIHDIKSASVNALTGSVPRKMPKGQQRVLAPIRNRTQVARLSVTHLNH